MSDNRLDTARRHSLFLARQLDNGKLKSEIFLPMLDKVLTEADFQAFADWDQIRAEENDEELARQLRELRRYVVSILPRFLPRGFCPSRQRLGSLLRSTPCPAWAGKFRT